MCQSGRGASSCAALGYAGVRAPEGVCAGEVNQGAGVSSCGKRGVAALHTATEVLPRYSAGQAARHVGTGSEWT